MQNFRFDFPREINCWYIIPLGRVLPERLMGMCCWIGLHFQDWIDYNGVAFSIEFTRMGSHIS